MSKNKKPIEWHLECLYNQDMYIAKEEETLKYQIAHLDKIKERNAFYAHQIRTAREKKIAEFDANTYLIKRIKKA